MLEEIWEAATGRWGLVALALLFLPASRKAIKTVAKEAVKAGIAVSEGVQELVSEIKEEASDVVAEVKAERKQHATHEKHSHKAHE
jgi:ABC-type sugar transport system substrate-binding protein